MPAAPASLPDRFYLAAASGLREFRPVYDALSGMEVYNLNPKEICAMQKPDAGELLRRDGSNAASVFQKLSEQANRRNAVMQKIGSTHALIILTTNRIIAITDTVFQF